FTFRFRTTVPVELPWSESDVGSVYETRASSFWMVIALIGFVALKFGSTHVAVTVWEPGFIWPVGVVPNGVGSIKGPFQAYWYTPPLSVHVVASPTTCVPTLKL